ncbi:MULTISPECIES: PLP-dependent aminotransferase family protein [Paenibacillus]|uniref:PLP-dependent aminotransferase family protein n=1 Tax=Paenibacillus violae TaxID=3077234 RepID=A0ABU3RN29_9BACL|nr:MULTISPECIES: PLP-dependent aminotransferase family protein [Paenibacillus]MDU0205589.1 PLP-dependent aminotransferase family protein [Paenibacillus sp. PFR10]MEC0268924.1 PLP-dependent aminotransferase family protein [Paenibacillus anseongense]
MLYEEIVDQMMKHIEDGTLKPGNRLPSIRVLTQEFACSKNTVMKAYGELEKRHIIYSVPQSGYYVVEGYRRREKLEGVHGTIDFLSAGPDRHAMPYRDFQHCINQAIERYKEEMFTYSDIQGLGSLRVQLARHLQELQVFTVPDKIYVVSGSQQALHLLVSLPFPNGKRHICLEQPTHAGFIESIRQHGSETYGIEVGNEGINLTRLEQLFKHNDIKLFYTVSRFHNPTGYSHTNETKRKIVELAQQYDVYIIEDDYMGDLDSNAKADPMFAYDPSGRVIYVKSFSKVMLPGLRLGLAVLPDALREDYLRAKFAADVHTPMLTQGALEIYLQSGMFSAHIERMRKLYSKKAALLQQAFQKWLPAVATYSGSLSGFYSTIELPVPIKAKQLQEYLKHQHVLVDHAERMYLPDFSKDNVIRLSISQVDEDLIERGVQMIAKGIAELLSRRTEVRFVSGNKNR